MSKCEKYHEMLSAYADGALSEQETAALTAHLDRCPSCRALLDIYRDISGASDTLLVEPPADFTAGVMEKVHAIDDRSTQPEMVYAVKKQPRSIWLRVAASAACLVLIIFAVRYIGTNGWKSADSAAAESAADMSVAYSVQDANDMADDAWADRSTESVPELETADSGAADNGENSAADSGGTADTSYYAVVTIRGQVPDILADCTFTDNGDGTLTAEIPADTAAKLADSGYTVELQDTEATSALVILYPADDRPAENP